MRFACGSYLTTCRHAALFKPDAPLVLGVALGSLLAALIGCYLALSRGESLLNVPPPMMPLLLADCVGIGIYGVMSAVATSYLPGAEVAFLLLLDVVLAPLLVTLVHGEVPTAAGSSGAALLAAAVVVDSANEEGCPAAAKLALAAAEDHLRAFASAALAVAEKFGSAAPPTRAVSSGGATDAAADAQHYAALAEHLDRESAAVPGAAAAPTTLPSREGPKGAWR